MRGRKLCLAVLGPILGWLVAALGGFFKGNLNIFVVGLGYIPSKWLLEVGAFGLWVSTVKIRQALKHSGLVEFEDCFEHNASSTLKVIVSAPKGGAYYSGFLANKVAKHCGLSVGVGTLAEDDWRNPNPDHLPQHEVDFLMAIGMSTNHWPEYLDLPFNANKKLQCVVMTRNPFERFLSLYKYTRDAGEIALREYSREIKQMKDVEERVKYVWKTIGKSMMKRTHSLLTISMNHNCTQIKSDELFFVSSEKHDELLEVILKTYGVKDHVVPDLMKILQKNDMNRMTKEQKASIRHISGKSLEVGEKEAVKKFIRNYPEISDVLSSQCGDLKFDC